ncbi:MAG: hypothetical protein ACO3NK_06955, partial [Prochlorotrichaceae cyanobacterium]
MLKTRGKFGDQVKGEECGAALPLKFFAFSEKPKVLRMTLNQVRPRKGWKTHDNLASLFHAFSLG